MDNLIKLYRDPALLDTAGSTTEEESGSAEAAGVTAGAGQAWAWKSNLSPDLANSPFSQKFEDTKEGLNKAMESYGNLEKLLGHEKVPIPKDANDIEGWSRFNKAMGIPEKADGYGLEDAKLPEDMAKNGITLNKTQFAEFMHKRNVHPSAVKGLWEDYQKANVEAYGNALKAHQENLTNTINELKSEWGSSYQSKVELGQSVINKFSDNKEMNDYITNTLSKDPRGIKFLAKIGDQFSENKIGDFGASRFSVTPEQAMEEADKMRLDINGPYMNQSGKFTEAEHQRAVERVNSLIAAAQKGR